MHTYVCLSVIHNTSLTSAYFGLDNREGEYQNHSISIPAYAIEQHYATFQKFNIINVVNLQK
jgi:hypothetical protein